MQYINSDGSYRLELSGNVVMLKGSGTWSELAINRYKQDMQQIVRQLDGKGWAFIGYLSGEAVLSPKVEKELIKLVQWRAEHGMAACAIVLNNTDCPAMVRSQFKRIYEQAKVDFQFVMKAQDAINWLLKRGYQR